MTRVGEAVKALALCHNVTPVYEDGSGQPPEESQNGDQPHTVLYQASSPDEVCHWSSDFGLLSLVPTSRFLCTILKTYIFVIF